MTAEPLVCGEPGCLRVCVRLYAGLCFAHYRKKREARMPIADCVRCGMPQRIWTKGMSLSCYQTHRQEIRTGKTTLCVKRQIDQRLRGSSELEATTVRGKVEVRVAVFGIHRADDLESMRQALIESAGAASRWARDRVTAAARSKVELRRRATVPGSGPAA